jgi:hypothetical protein
MADTLDDELNDDIEDEVDGGVAEDDFYGAGVQEDRLESSEVSLDSSHRQIHTSAVSDITIISTIVACFLCRYARYIL